MAIRHAYARSGLCVTLLVALLTVAHAEPRPTTTPTRTAGVIAICTGALGVFFGLAFTVRSIELRDNVRDACAAGCDWSDPTLKREDAAGHRANTMAEIGLVGGGAAVIGGVVLYLVGRPAPVTVAPAEGGAVVLTRFAFQ